MSKLEVAQAGAMAVAVPPVAVRASRARALLRLLGAAATFIVVGCVSFGQPDPKAQRAADIFRCYVAVIEPYVGDAVDVAELVQGAIKGEADLMRALSLLGATQEDLQAVLAGMNACKAPAPVVAPPVNPRTLASLDAGM